MSGGKSQQGEKERGDYREGREGKKDVTGLYHYVAQHLTMLSIQT